MDFPGEKLVIKLWETLAEKGVGGLLAPWQIGREGRARIELRRQELLVLAQAEQEIADSRAGRRTLDVGRRVARIEATSNPVPHAVESSRAEPSFGIQEVMAEGLASRQASAARAEVNVSKAVIYAEDQLANDPQPASQGTVDDDWLFTWKEYAGRVSAEDLQQLWGSVLAGEVKTPGKYSLRTLEFLKALSKEDAELITKIAGLVIQSAVVKREADLLQRGLGMGVWLHAQEIGVVSGVGAAGLQNNFDSVLPDRFVRPLISNGKVLVVEHEDRSKMLSLDIYKLTGVGLQVMSLGTFAPDVEYLRGVGKDLIAQGFAVKLADWRQISDTEGRYENAVVLDG